MSWSQVWGAAVVFVIGLGVTPHAARGADDDVVDKMTAGRIERILAESAVENVTEVGNNAYRMEAGGLKLVLFNMEETLQLYAGFRDRKITLSRINEWNKSKRFSRAYLDKQNDPVIEADIELTGGVTQKNIKEWIKTFLVSVNAFQKHLDE